MSVTIRAYINAATSDNAVATRDSSKQASLACDQVFQGTQTVATAATLISFGSITGTTPPKFWVKNLDSVNYVQLYSVTSVGQNPTNKLLAGEANLISLASITLYGVANTTPVKLEICAA